MESKLFWRLLVSALVLMSAVQGSRDQGFTEEDLASEKSLWSLYEKWAAQYRDEALDQSSHERRFQIFKDNVRYIHSRNKQIQHYHLGLNKFADLTNSEFRAKYLSSSLPQESTNKKQPFTYNPHVSVPTSVDWVAKGVVGTVKNQGQCGCCWAFSAVAAIESITAINTGSVPNLSEQQLVDCDYNNNGCNGGYMDRAFQYLINEGGSVAEDVYPYQEMQYQCRVPGNTYKVTIDNYQNVDQCNENALMQAVASQPVSVGVEGGGNDFQHYRGGIFTGYCGNELNHAITLVGYDRAGGSDYWIAKNSWGTGWGESGYMRIQRNYYYNSCGLCGIATYPTYPIQYHHGVSHNATEGESASHSVA